MIEHATEVIQLLFWLIVVIGGCLIGLMGWVGRRLQDRVDALPKQVAEQVSQVHDQLLDQMRQMNDTHEKLEKDMRESLTALDRRVVRLEVRCELNHGGKP